MALRVAFFAALFAAASCTLVDTQAKCGPQTKISFTDSENAAGTPVFGTPVGPADGACVSVMSNIKAVSFCGPGTLTLSRLSCGRHDYKQVTYEHSAAEYTTNCENIDLAGTNVDGHLATYIVKC